MHKFEQQSNQLSYDQNTVLHATKNEFMIVRRFQKDIHLKRTSLNNSRIN